jgi:hypothetical protein
MRHKLITCVFSLPQGTLPAIHYCSFLTLLLYQSDLCNSARSLRTITLDGYGLPVQDNKRGNADHDCKVNIVYQFV